MATILEISGKGLITVTYYRDGQEISELCYVSPNYKHGINDRIPHNITTIGGVKLFGVIVLPNQQDRYFAALSRNEYDSMFEYYIENKSDLEQEARERRQMQQEEENWFPFRTPKRCKSKNRKVEEDFKPFICYSNAFETNRRKH